MPGRVKRRSKYGKYFDRLTTMRSNRTMGKPVLNAKITEFKTCIRCRETKTSESFGVDKRATDRRKSECKQCRNTAAKESRKYMTQEQRDIHNERTKRYYVSSQRSRAIHLVNAARNRKNRKCYLTVDHIYNIIKDHGRCAMSDIKFQFTDGKQKRITPFSPSLDRKNNEEDYTPDNVQVVCTMYNLGKAHHSETDFIAMCMAVANKNKDNEKALQRMRELIGDT